MLKTKQNYKMALYSSPSLIQVSWRPKIPQWFEKRRFTPFFGLKSLLLQTIKCQCPQPCIEGVHNTFSHQFKISGLLDAAITSEELMTSRFMLQSLYVFKQVFICISCWEECYNAILPWSSRNVLWSIVGTDVLTSQGFCTNMMNHLRYLILPIKGFRFEIPDNAWF